MFELETNPWEFFSLVTKIAKNICSKTQLTLTAAVETLADLRHPSSYFKKKIQRFLRLCMWFYPNWELRPCWTKYPDDLTRLLITQLKFAFIKFCKLQIFNEWKSELIKINNKAEQPITPLKAHDPAHDWSSWIDWTSLTSFKSFKHM